jgi:selenocysteine lyase/cysteine desulfurase
MKPADLYNAPNALAPHYTHFKVGQRLLLSGHSHQAWPDVALDGQRKAFLDAAEFVDEKWTRAFAVADEVRAGWARLLNDTPERVALGNNTHELVVRWLSALPLTKHRRIVTTDGEFHSIRRLVDRLAEEGIEMVRVAADPVATLSERLAAEVKAGTAAVMVSSVLFRSAEIVPNLTALAAACDRAGVPLLVDAYHHLNIVPFSIRELGLENAYVTGGGYKYCQLGEGNGFLRFPAGCALRPVITGWYSEFATKEAPIPNTVAYGDGPARFGGATYDPTSHYRAAEVFRFFAAQQLTPTLLREVSQHQEGRLLERFDALDLDPALIDRDRDRPLQRTAGFVVLRTARAGEICRALHARDVFTDYRGDVLRVGPAPYVSDARLDDAMTILGDVCGDLA